MAEAILLSAFLPVVFEKTTSLLLNQFTAIWGTDVHKELTKLTETLMTVQAVLEEAEKKQLENQAIRLWLSRLKDVVYEADDIVDEFQWLLLRKKADIRTATTVRHFFSSENPLLFRVRMGRRISEVVERFDVVAAQPSKFHGLLSLIHHDTDTPNSRQRHLAAADGSSGGTQTHSCVAQSSIVGRREDLENIVEMLLSQENNASLTVIPIVGMPGLGKTTLAKMVYNEPHVKKHFQLQMWVCVSETFHFPKLADAILGSVKGNRSGADLSMEHSLREMLSSRRYLLVLDDVWNEDVTMWENLKVLLSFGGEGSVVITTTRSGVVASIMGTIDPYKLPRLSEDECWNLFKQKSFPRGRVEHPELVDIGKKIVNRFGGLPLAAATVGSLMSRKHDKREWLSVLNNKFWNIPTGEGGLLPALKLSYDHLPLHLKQCFVFCAIFPKNYLLEDAVLIQLWMANGFIPSQGSMELEDTAHEIFNELASRSFFQDVEETKYLGYPRGCLDNNTTRTCRMHDLVHDLASSFMGNECCILESENSARSLNVKTRHITIGKYINTANIVKDIAKCETVRTLVDLRGYYDTLPEQFWLNVAHSLRAVCYTGPIESNFSSICKSRHLRYLDLSGSRFEALPEAITSLFHLQTLKIAYCRSLRKLPRNMKNMKSLRHLYLQESTSELKFMPNGMGTLSSLQTLSDYVVGNVSGGGDIGEMKNLNSIGGSLSLWKLENVKNAASAKEANLIDKERIVNLNLSWNLIMENTEDVLEVLRPHRSIESLEINRYGGIHFPNWLMECPLHLPNLVRVVLRECIHCEHLPQLGQLPSLVYLQLSGMNAVKYMGGSTFYGYGNCNGNGGGGGSSVFPSLKYLQVSKMPNLEEWQGVEAIGGAKVAFFPQLTNLKICYCPKLKAIPCIPSIQEFKTEGDHLIPLEKTFFENMKSIKSIKIEHHDQPFSLPDILRCDLSSLKEIHISKCRNLGSDLSSPSNGGGPQPQYLTSLERLKISGSEKLAGLSKCIGSLPQLRYLVISSCKNLESLQGGLGDLMALEDLSVVDCPNLTTFSGELGGLTAIRHFYVSECPKLTVFPDQMGVLANVRYLHISSCYNLASLQGGIGGLMALESLLVNHCPKLTTFPDELGSLRTLNYLYISNCSNLTTIPEGLEGLTDLSIILCRKLTSLPNSLLQRLPTLRHLCICQCHRDLQRQFGEGGVYADQISKIPNIHIQDIRSSLSLSSGLSPICFRGSCST